MKPIAAAKEYVRENVDFPTHLIVDRLTNADATATSVDEVPACEGRIVALEGRKYAVHRHADGTLRAMSPICPHLGCDVRWNVAEGSWDCPCHGSRFDADGLVVNGPAVRGLAPMALPRPARRASR